MHFYKAQVFSYLESSTPSIYHSAPTTLDRIDRVQRRFLADIGMDERRSLIDWRLAPLASRRDIAMLGVLHKIALGKAPQQLADIFPIVGHSHEPMRRQHLRNWRPLHNRQILSHAGVNSTHVMQRSLFGLVHCYNFLPQRLVDAQSVKQFQRKLQHGLMEYAQQTDGSWAHLFNVGWRSLNRVQFDQLFR